LSQCADSLGLERVDREKSSNLIKRVVIKMDLKELVKDKMQGIAQVVNNSDIKLKQLLDESLNSQNLLEWAMKRQFKLGCLVLLIQKKE
jgi:hypothetical protein